MSHLHIPDGVLPLWLVLLGWGITALLLAFITRRLRAEEMTRRLPLLGVISALMLISMSAEIAPIAYHINLSIIAGILLGPALGFLAAFLANLILAFFGHGGITVVGLNTLVIGFEVTLGHYGYRLCRALLRGQRPGLAAGLTTAPVLLLSTLLMIGIVAVSNVQPARYIHAEPGGSGALHFHAPWEKEHGEEPAAPAEAKGTTNIRTFATLVLSLGVIGWILESLVNALIISYVARIRPDLTDGAPAQVE